MDVKIERNNFAKKKLLSQNVCYVDDKMKGKATRNCFSSPFLL